VMFDVHKVQYRFVFFVSTNDLLRAPGEVRVALGWRK
jgi:hypothetical protein